MKNIKLLFTVGPKVSLFKEVDDNGMISFVMKGGKQGDHRVYERGYTERVAAHWIGYLQNNGLSIDQELY